MYTRACRVYRTLALAPAGQPVAPGLSAGLRRLERRTDCHLEAEVIRKERTRAYSTQDNVRQYGESRVHEAGQDTCQGSGKDKAALNLHPTNTVFFHSLPLYMRRARHESCIGCISGTHSLLELHDRASTHAMAALRVAPLQARSHL